MHWALCVASTVQGPLIDFSVASSTVLTHLLLLGCTATCHCKGWQCQKPASSGSPAAKTCDSHLGQRYPRRRLLGASKKSFPSPVKCDNGRKWFFLQTVPCLHVIPGTVAAILWAWGSKTEHKVKRPQGCQSRNVERAWAFDDIVELMNQRWNCPTPECLAMLNNKPFLLGYSMVCSILPSFNLHENPMVTVIICPFYRWGNHKLRRLSGTKSVFFLTTCHTYCVHHQGLFIRAVCLSWLYKGRRSVRTLCELTL